MWWEFDLAFDVNRTYVADQQNCKIMFVSAVDVGSATWAFRYEKHSGVIALSACISVGEVCA